MWQTTTVRSVARSVRGLLKRRFGSALRFTQLTNLTLLTLAALHGCSLQPAALARRLQTRTTFCHNEKRVHRFAGNRRLPRNTIFGGLLGMILTLGPRGKLVPVTIVDETDLPADEAQERYRLRMRIEEDSRDLKTTLGLKHLRPRKDVEQRVAHLLLLAMVTACVTAYLYPRAVAEQTRVVKRPSDVSFVRLVVMVYRLRWSCYVGGVG